MTVLGKTLVFVNLVFSLVMGALVIMVFTSRTKWTDAAKKLDASVKVERSSTEAYRAEADAAQRQAQAQVGEMQAKLDAGNKELARVTEESKAKDAQIAGDRAKYQQAEATIASLKLDAERHTQEVDILAKEKGNIQRRLDDQIKFAGDMRDRAVKADIEKLATQDRNGRLLEQVQGLERQVQDLRTKGGAVAGGAASPSADNPPPESVEGLVKKVDAASGMVTLSIGSDAGLVKGHTLEIFRLDGGGKYLGKIRIMETRPSEAVGKPVGRTNGPVQVGDHAASKIQ